MIINHGIRVMSHKAAVPIKAAILVQVSQTNVRTKVAVVAVVGAVVVDATAMIAAARTPKVSKVAARSKPHY